MRTAFPLRCFGLMLVLMWTPFLYGQSGDTVVVQTFSFSDPAPATKYVGDFQFPAAGESYEKILMYYTLKCDASTQADNFPCGEWDYLTYTYITDSAGVMDSTFRTQRRFRLAAGSTPDTLPLHDNPVWDYIQDTQYVATYPSGVTPDAFPVGSGSSSSNAPFEASQLSSRVQFLWRKEELKTQGLKNDSLTGMRFDLTSTGTELRNLRISLKLVSADTLDPTQPENGGFTEVYRLNSSFAGAGWQTLVFHQPFVYDTLFNLLVDIRFENMVTGSDHVVNAETVGFSAGLIAADSDYYLHLDGKKDFVNLGRDAQVTGANPRTVEMWARANRFNGGGIFQVGRPGSTGRDFSLRTMGSDNLWRVQLWGTPDFDATLPGSKGSWHHYAVSFDGSVARLYYDGQLAAQKSVTINTPSADVLLGQWYGTLFDGDIDEVRLWDVAIDPQTLAEWKDKRVDNSHPDYANLKGYYSFDEGQGYLVQDASPTAASGSLMGIPAWRRKAPEELTNFSATNLRPNIILETSSSAPQVATQVSIDSLPQAPLQIIRYQNPSGPYIIRDDDPNHPSLPTDTLLAWNANAFQYTLDRNGMKLDSSQIGTDQTLVRDDHEYFSNIVRYEIARYITPYGINLDLGPEGKRWIFDVTDYAPILRDWVHLEAGNNQELLDLKFVMIKGTPPRQVRKIENLWVGNWSYASILNGTNGQPITKYLDPDAEMFRIKMRISGHGFGGPSNCAEFCARYHNLSLNGTQFHDWRVWNECADNPLFPQGGTWIYDRAGWCPGAEVTTMDQEFTDLAAPGDTVVLDYGIQNNNPWGPEGNWVVESQLITYGGAEHQQDAAIVDIISPTDEFIHSRKNPVCNNPTIRIKNTGAETLTSVLITYGIKDGPFPCYFRWTGSLEFLQETEVELPPMNWTGLDPNNPQFFAELSFPNYGQDEYAANDRMEASFTLPDIIPTNSVLEIQTNAAGIENKYTIRDADGNAVKQRFTMANNTKTEDLLDLPLGCYTLTFEDAGDDGICFWANNDGCGYIRIQRPDGTIFKTFNPDFGKSIVYHFTVGYVLGNHFENYACDANVAIDPPAILEGLKVYPNPTAGNLVIEWEQNSLEPITLKMYDLQGRVVFAREQFSSVEGRIELETGLRPGLYMLSLRTRHGRVTRQVVVQ